MRSPPHKSWLSPLTLACVTLLGTIQVTRGSLVDEPAGEFEATTSRPELSNRDRLALQSQISQGVVLAERGEYEKALGHFKAALALDDHRAETWRLIGVCFVGLGNHVAARKAFGPLVMLEPGDARAHLLLGISQANTGDIEAAIKQFREVIRIEPEHPRAHGDLALSLLLLGRAKEAVPSFEKALQISPDWVDALNGLGWILATHPDPAIRNGEEAVRLCERANELTGGQKVDVMDTLAAAYAETGRFEEAAATGLRAHELAQEYGLEDLVRSTKRRLDAYRKNEPYRDAELH